jgi:two-component system response regulator AtoC
MATERPSRAPAGVGGGTGVGTGAGVGVGTGTRFRLLVATGASVETFNLPAGGDVSIGGGADCDVRIDDARLADKQALLLIGPELVLRDLGSPDGCRVGGRRLAPNESVAISPGVVIAIGATTLVVQRAQQTARLRPLRSHSYFEARVEDECIRAETSRTRFSLLRLRCRPNVASKVEIVLAHWLRPMDVVSMLAANEHELLFVDTAPERARVLCEAIVNELGEDVLGYELSSYPRETANPSETATSLETATPRAAPSVVPPPPLVLPVEATSTSGLTPELEAVARGTVSVILVGEPGVGKEVAANAMHRWSSRAKGPLVAVSCALGEAALESELFGHERGAFAGAHETKIGALERARGGSLFLDDILQLSQALQVRLLRALDQKQVMRMGALRPRTIDVRVLVATDRDLEGEVTRGAFRSDLFYRLAGAIAVIPPLRERRDEIIGLAESFVAQSCPPGSPAAQRGVPVLSAEARAILESYAWPGNIRELRAVIERAVHTCRDGSIGAEHLRRLGERDEIVNALAQCAGNQSQAARLLGMSRKTLVKRLDEFALPRPRKWVP